MSTTDAYARPDPALIAELRERIQDIGGRGGRRREAPLSLGIKAVDAALPWGGLPRACLHEVAAAGFSAVLLARLAGRTGTVVWCRRPPPPTSMVPDSTVPDWLPLGWRRRG